MSEPPVLYPVDRPGPGRLALMPAPRGGDRLRADVTALVTAGVTDVVCLLGDRELTRLGLAAESGLLAAHDVRWHRLPVRDFGVPRTAPTRPLVAELRSRLAAGAFVVVHCRGGVGRSSTVVAAVLVADGVPVRDAWRLVRRARGRRVPETVRQRWFVARFARSVAGRSRDGGHRR